MRTSSSGVSSGRYLVTKAVAERAAALLRSGVSQRKMGAEIGYDRVTLMDAIKRYGLNYDPMEGDTK